MSSVAQQVRAVLFDLYGTLADIETDEHSAKMWTALSRWIYVRMGREIQAGDLQNSYQNETRALTRERGYGFVLDLAFARLLGPGASESEVLEFASLFRRYSIVSLSTRDYTKKLLSMLRNDGLKLGLISNTEAILTDYDLSVLSISGYFDTITLSSRAGIEKPNPKIVLDALSELGVGASAAVFVGDSIETDIAVARAAGLRAILVSSELNFADREPGMIVVPPRLDAIMSALDRI
jgi:putative hydrolase of the HAD superfamily